LLIIDTIKYRLRRPGLWHRGFRLSGMTFLLWVIVVGLLLASASLYSAPLPDPSKPRAAPQHRPIISPVAPNMRRFLAEPAPVKNRKQAIDEARLSVNSIQLMGVVDRPDHDILLEELAEFVEKKRLAAVALQTRLKRDSPEPMNMQGQEESTSESVDKKPSAELQEMEVSIEQFLASKAPENLLTLQQLQEIAAGVAQYYRDRGFILVRAVIPPQTIKEGRLRIRVLEGILGNVLFEKNTHYNSEQLMRPFRELLNEPVTKDAIEQAMLLLNDYPGLRTFAVFRPGLKPGETDLLVSVLEESNRSTTLHMDNYGSEFTGEYRGRINVDWNNPTNNIDRLRISLSKTYDPGNGNFGSLYYERNAFGPKNIFGLGASVNRYSLGAALEVLGISGVTKQAQIYWRRAFHRSRLFNSYALLQLSRKSAKLDVTTGSDQADELTVLSVAMGFDWSSASRRHMINANLQYSQGYGGLLGAMEATTDPTLTSTSRQGGSLLYAGGDFSKVNLDYALWYRFKPNHMLHVSFRGQSSQDLLTSLEQMAIGGPNSVRAYSAAEFLRDKALSTSIEWLINAPGFSQWKAFGRKRWGEVLQVAFFADYAKGWLNDPLASDREVASLSGIGTGLRFQYEDFSMRFEFASPLGDEKPGNDRDPQYFFEMNYVF